MQTREIYSDMFKEAKVMLWCWCCNSKVSFTKNSKDKHYKTWIFMHRWKAHML